jgi:nitrogen-specific signal transduction histidine kinase
VVDRGPGLPERIKSRLFTPCTSGKPGGGGIGLAISQQLAQHLGARLELAGTSTCGTIFQLVIPRDV